MTAGIIRETVPGTDVVAKPDHRYGPVRLDDGREPPSRVRRGYLNPYMSVDQVSTVTGSSGFVRGVELSDRRALVATQGRFEVFEYRNAEGEAIRSLGSTPGSHTGIGFRPKLVRVDDHRAVMIWAASVGGVIVITTFDDRTMKVTETTTNVLASDDPYAHNPQLGVLPQADGSVTLVVFANSGSTQATVYSWGVYDGTLEVRQVRTLDLGPHVEGTPVGFEPGGRVVIAVGVWDGDTLVMFGRNGIGTTLRYWFNAISVSSGARGSEVSPWGYFDAPSLEDLDVWEHGPDVFQAGAMGQVKMGGKLVGITSRKGRFGPSGQKNFADGTTRPGHRFFVVDSVVGLDVTVQVDILLLLQVIDLSDAQQFLFDDFQVSRDSGNRFSANAYGGGAGGQFGGTTARIFGFDMGNRDTSIVSGLRLLLGYQTFNYDPNTFDGFQLQGTNFGIALPIPAPTRNVPLYLGPTRAWFLVAIDGGEVKKARVFHDSTITRGLLATRWRQRVSDYDPFYVDYLL